MPTYPRVKDKSLTRDPDATFGPLGGDKEQYPMHRLPYALALQIAGTRKGIRWLSYGSSIADYKIREIGWKLMKMYGGQQAGVVGLERRQR